MSSSSDIAEHFRVHLMGSCAFLNCTSLHIVLPFKGFAHSSFESPDSRKQLRNYACSFEMTSLLSQNAP